MDRETDIIKGICEHLRNEDVYKKLAKTEANQKMPLCDTKLTYAYSNTKKI